MVPGNATASEQTLAEPQGTYIPEGQPPPAGDLITEYRKADPLLQLGHGECWVSPENLSCLFRRDVSEEAGGQR